MTDQTNPAWLTGRGPTPVHGTGLYADGTPDRFTTRYVGDVTYDDFIGILRQQAEPFVYRWVPHHIASETDIVATVCVPAPCFEEGEWCIQVGCFCVGGICRKT